MLARATKHIIAQARHTTIISRSPQHLGDTVDQASVTAIVCNWEQPTQFLAAIRDSADADGPYELRLCWLHTSGRQTLHRLLEFLDAQRPPCSVFHIRSATLPAPNRPPQPLADLVENLTHLNYRQIILGFKYSPTGTRWLTHDEICAGPLKALELRTPRYVIGTIRPWSDRPQTSN